MALTLKKQNIVIPLRDGKSEPLPSITYGTWAVHRGIDGRGWTVTHIPTGKAFVHPRSQKQGIAYLEEMDNIDNKLMWAKSENDIKRYADALRNLMLNPPQVSKRRTPVRKPDILDFKGILTNEGLQSLGRRYGKAGEFYGIPGSSRAISIGKRDILLNEFLVGISSPDQIRRPDTRWNMFKAELKSKITEDELRKWIQWAKNGVSTKELREMARRSYNAKEERGEKDPVVILTGGRVKRRASVVAERYLKKHAVRSDDPWVQAAQLIDGGFGYVEKSLDLGSLKRGFAQAKKELEGHRKHGVGETESVHLMQSHILPAFEDLQKTSSWMLDHLKDIIKKSRSRRSG